MNDQTSWDWNRTNFITPSVAGALLSALKGRCRKLSGRVAGRRRRRLSLVRWYSIHALLLGALRGKAVICWCDYSKDDVPFVHAVPADEIELIPVPAAQMLGRLKKGVKEKPSKKKAAACRRNGSMPCRPGCRRGRPRK